LGVNNQFLTDLLHQRSLLGDGGGAFVFLEKTVHQFVVGAKECCRLLGFAAFGVSAGLLCGGYHKKYSCAVTLGEIA
jgi:hypothetical protein